jgi:hypothetical protein
MGYVPTFFVLRLHFINYFHSIILAYKVKANV